MLTSISLANFKSYGEAEMPLAPLTFLIGQNASGKSNVLEAIRLLSWLAAGSRLDDIERRIQGQDTVVRGRARDLFLDETDPLQLRAVMSGERDVESSELRIGIRLLSDQLVVAEEQVKVPGETVPLYKVDSAPNPHSDEISVAYNNFARGGVKPHIPCSNRQAVFYQLQSPGRFQKTHERSQALIPNVLDQIRRTLTTVLFLDPRPSQMRGYSFAGRDALQEDGGNLSAVIYRICQSDQDKEVLLDFVRSLPEQQITEIDFIETDRRDVMVRLKETFGDSERLVDAPLLSDGTLRVLAVGAALLSAEKGTLVILEEIDNGVHPSRADALVRSIRSIAEQRGLRVVLTSHNPALLDALDDNVLADVVCCFRDALDGRSRLTRLGDLDRFAELAAGGPLGTLMTRRVVERFLKDDSTPEERREAGLEWLETLRTGTEGAS